MRRVKELIRSVISDRSWKLPKALVDDVIVFAVNRLNMRRASNSSGEVTDPRAKFTGRKPSFKKEFSVSFGDYCECYMPGVTKNDVFKDLCLALYPTGDASGSWIMYDFKTRRRVRRTNLKKIITTQLVINAANQLLTDEDNGIEIAEALDDGVQDTGSVSKAVATNLSADETLNTGVLPHHVVEQANVDDQGDECADMPELSNDSDSDDNEDAQDEDDMPPALVDDPDSEDEDDEDDKEVAMDSMLVRLYIAAKEGRQLATVDIGGAYLNASMDDEEVFMELDSGADIDVPTVQQDNTSTIPLVTNGGEYRDEYMRVRQQWVLKMLRDGDVKIAHVGTGQMVADGLTNGNLEFCG
jgi:hypothetical protein